MDLKRFSQMERTVEFVVFGETFEVKYLPSRLNTGLLYRAQEYEAEKKFSLSAFILSEVLTDWNITSDGKKVEITLEVIESLPAAIQSAMLTAIVDDMKTDQAPTFPDIWPIFRTDRGERH